MKRITFTLEELVELYKFDKLTIATMKQLMQEGDVLDENFIPTDAVITMKWFESCKTKPLVRIAGVINIYIALLEYDYTTDVTESDLIIAIANKINK